MVIFLCPALLDLVAFLVLFAVTYGAGERHMPTIQVAWLGGVFQIAYMTVSFGSGLVLSRRNARFWLLGGTAASILTATLCLYLQAFIPLLIAMGAFGIATAFFFNPFQTFMRSEAPPGGLRRSTGLYTIAWSTGSSIGVLSAGLFYALGAHCLAAINGVVGIAVIAFLLRYRPRSQDAPSAEESVEEGGPGTRPVNPSYVWVGWIIIFTAMFVQRPVQTFYPKVCAELGVHPGWAGTTLFLHMLIQGIAGFLMVRFRSLLYRRLPFAAFHLGAALVCLLLWKSSHPILSSALIALLGVWAGFAYFCAVYYAGNSGNRSRNVGVNECLVGLGSLAGLFLTERFMAVRQNYAVLYLVCAVALVVSVLLQWLVATRRRPTPLAGSTPY